MSNPEDTGKDAPQDPPNDNDEPENSGAPDDSNPEDDSAENDSAAAEEETGDAPLVQQEINLVPPPPEKKSRRGFVDFLILLVLAGLGGGEYVLYKKQKADSEWVAMKVAGVEHKLKGLANRKPDAPAAPGVSPEVQATLDNLTAQVGELQAQLEQTRRQTDETRSRLESEIEQLKSAPPPAPPIEEEPVAEEPPVEEEHAEEAEPAPHGGGDDAHPEEDFIEFVENMFRIVGQGIKDGIVFVWDSLTGLAGGTDES